MQLFWLLVLTGLAFGPLSAQAVTREKVREKSDESPSARSGPYAFVEVNPADLVQRRMRLDAEYVIVDGFAFGVATEYQNQSLAGWRHSTAAAGLTVTQYLQSQTLKGPFIKGEADFFGSVFEVNQKSSRQRSVYGLGLGLDVGYRFSITKRITGGAAYGVRRLVPDFFANQGSDASREFAAYAKIWDLRMQLSVGLAL